jgi:hypothetical protein
MNPKPFFLLAVASTLFCSCVTPYEEHVEMDVPRKSQPFVQCEVNSQSMSPLIHEELAHMYLSFDSLPSELVTVRGHQKIANIIEKGLEYRLVLDVTDTSDSLYYFFGVQRSMTGGKIVYEVKLEIFNDFSKPKGVHRFTARACEWKGCLSCPDNINCEKDSLLIVGKVNTMVGIAQELLRKYTRPKVTG